MHLLHSVQMEPQGPQGPQVLLEVQVQQGPLVVQGPQVLEVQLVVQDLLVLQVRLEQTGPDHHQAVMRQFNTMQRQDLVEQIILQ